MEKEEEKLSLFIANMIYMLICRERANPNATYTHMHTSKYETYAHTSTCIYAHTYMHTHEHVYTHA